MTDVILLVSLIVAAVIFVPILPKLISGIGYRRSLASGGYKLHRTGTIGDFYSDFDTDVEDGIDPQVEAEHKTVSLEGFGCRMFNEETR
ncbi:MAG: hypothetical protein DUD27_05975 [Lachnospiraceae bacterium]|uniref:Uncharacterized protein n=1 Tax=Candidatus Weimeria bifida TaxID=2599074 RepID=A0A6N7J1A5_9FIRM|nr:hypothetical protein [Candidatus Weimeria bifida]RRF96213.1 MAG: hypothetical protein DUD27_05975 [Lachnospiraceae bacterium]